MDGYYPSRAARTPVTNLCQMFSMWLLHGTFQRMPAVRLTTFFVLPLVALAAGCAQDGPASGASASAGDRQVAVTEIVDGDTIRIEGGETVRLLQIDTPEVHNGEECWGPEASVAVTELVPPGTSIELVRDPDLDQIDRYGRLLRYVMVDDTNVNIELVERGHAAPYFYRGAEGMHSEALTSAATSARDAGMGLWGACEAAQLDASRGLATGSAKR